MPANNPYGDPRFEPTCEAIKDELELIRHLVKLLGDKELGLGYLVIEANAKHMPGEASVHFWRAHEVVTNALGRDNGDDREVAKRLILAGAYFSTLFYWTREALNHPAIGNFVEVLAPLMISENVVTNMGALLVYEAYHRTVS